jgi:hypothetical protein
MSLTNYIHNPIGQVQVSLVNTRNVAGLAELLAFRFVDGMFDGFEYRSRDASDERIAFMESAFTALGARFVSPSDLGALKTGFRNAVRAATEPAHGDYFKCAKFDLTGVSGHEPKLVLRLDALAFNVGCSPIDDVAVLVQGFTASLTTDEFKHSWKDSYKASLVAQEATQRRAQQQSEADLAALNARNAANDRSQAQPTQAAESQIVKARRLVLEALDSNPDQQHRSQRAIIKLVQTTAPEIPSYVVINALQVLMNDRLVFSRPSVTHGSLYSRRQS